MDIVTHALMGSILAAPFLGSAPLAATAFVFGSVLPDLDALSRLFGKRVFLQAHQTYTHALPIIALLGLASYPAFVALGVDDPTVSLVLALGMVFHSLLDVTNTYGIALFLPFSKRRFCTEWVFFIDSVVLAACAITLAFLGPGLQPGAAPVLPTVIFVTAMLLYWLGKALLRRRAGQRSPDGTLALLPSALLPWHFLGSRRQGDRVESYLMNALTGRISHKHSHAVLDNAFQTTLQSLPEYRAMSALSELYHVTEAEQGDQRVRLRCRDLRTRNFNTRFGELSITLDSAGAIQEYDFHA